jgi:hypothetical protein
MLEAGKELLMRVEKSDTAKHLSANLIKVPNSRTGRRLFACLAVIQMRPNRTVVETDLAAPTDRGLILSPTDGTGAGPESLPDVSSVQVTTVGNVAVLGESDAFAREMVTPRVREAIAALENGATIGVGLAADLFLDALEDTGDGLAGSMVGLVEEDLRERLPGGPESVGIEREGVILDGATLEARVRAVVAVADAFEDATTDGRPD